MGSELKELFVGENKTRNIIIAGVVLIVAFILWDVYGRAVLPDDGRGADAVRTGLSNAQTEQHSTTDSIGKVESQLIDAGNTAHTITGQLEEARTTNTNVIDGNSESQSNITSSREIIDRFQARLQAIRERGKQ